LWLEVSGEWGGGIGKGEWGVRRGEWKGERGKWEEESGEWRVGEVSVADGERGFLGGGC
jgi:hypothetical protein